MWCDMWSQASGEASADGTRDFSIWDWESLINFRRARSIESFSIKLTLATIELCKQVVPRNVRIDELDQPGWT